MSSFQKRLLSKPVPFVRGETYSHVLFSLVPWTYGCGSKPMGSHFGVGEFTTHLRTYFSGWIESDVRGPGF